MLGVSVGPMSGHLRTQGGTHDRSTTKNTGFSAQCPLYQGRPSLEHHLSTLVSLCPVDGPCAFFQGRRVWTVIMLSRSSLLVLIYHVLTSFTAPTTYDQRQTGDLNVQVHWKDLQIITLFDKELLDDYTEYDYFYDYADFTLKPSEQPTKPTENPSTASSLETTVKPEAIESLNSTQNSSLSNEDSVSNSTVEDASESSTSNADATTEKIENPVDENQKLRHECLESLYHENLSNLSKRCRSIFQAIAERRLNQKRKQGMRFVPTAMKLVPKLLDSLVRSTKQQPS